LQTTRSEKHLGVDRSFELPPFIFDKAPFVAIRWRFRAGRPIFAFMITTLRLYLLRALYFMMALFLTTQILPQVIMRGTQFPHMSGVARALLAALGLLALVGIRYPIKMLPILLFELLWKAIWVFAIGLPLRIAHQLDAGQAQTLIDCTVGVVLCVIAIPWPYVIDTYFRAAGDRWKIAHAAAEPANLSSAR
jgi:hypothetical protein